MSNPSHPHLPPGVTVYTPSTPLSHPILPLPTGRGELYRCCGQPKTRHLSFAALERTPEEVIKPRRRQPRKKPKGYELPQLPPPPPVGEDIFAVHSPWSSPSRSRRDRGSPLPATPSRNLSKALEGLHMTISGPVSFFDFLSGEYSYH